MTTREQHIHMARVYLHQARCTGHRAWRFTLMQWAADRRIKATACSRTRTSGKVVECVP
jgi:hypothetical protein